MIKKKGNVVKDHVKVVFKTVSSEDGWGKKEYLYRCKENTVQVGDLVVLQSNDPRTPNLATNICLVVGFPTATEVSAFKEKVREIIGVVIPNCDDLISKEYERKIIAVKRAMAKRMAELDEAIKMRMYAEIDDDFREMYESVYGQLK